MAANSYSNRGIYIHVFAGTPIPDNWKEHFIPLNGEGRSWAVLNDNSKLVKNCFLGRVTGEFLNGTEVIRRIVHAEDAGKLALLTAEEAKALVASIGIKASD